MKAKLAQLILNARAEQGYSQHEVAEAVSMSVSCYQQVEAGEKMPRTLDLLRLVLFLRLDMEDLREEAGLIVPVSSSRRKENDR